MYVKLINRNVLFVFVPIGWALHFVKAGGNDSISDTAVFITNFIAIIPLGASFLSFQNERANDQPVS
jgi:Ca2+:H+ antiporter